MKRATLHHRLMLSLILCSVLLLGVFGCGRTNWELKDGTLLIRGEVGMQEWLDYLYSFPESEADTIRGAVEKIEVSEDILLIPGNAFMGCTNLEEAVLADSIEAIGNGAFAECTSLEKVKWPKNLRFIEQFAFLNTNLIEVELPPKVKEVGLEAFYDCSFLKRIILSESIMLSDDVVDYNFLEAFVFLKGPPQNIGGISVKEIFEYYALEKTITIYYLKGNEHLWVPSGETEWNGCPLVAIDSLDDLPPLN